MRTTKGASLASILSACLMAAPASAATSVTIGSDVDTNRATTISFFDPIGQSFTAVTDTLTSFGFEFTALNGTAANGPITFNLFAGETLTGTSLFTSTFTLPSGINSRDVQQFVDVLLPNVAVTRNSQYTAVLTTGSTRPALLVSPGFNVATNQFTGGDAYAGGRLLGTPAPYANCSGSANNCDANFRVTGNLLSAPVPEPSTWAMMLLGFGAIGATLRRRRSVISAMA